MATEKNPVGLVLYVEKCSLCGAPCYSYVAVRIGDFARIVVLCKKCFAEKALPALKSTAIKMLFKLYFPEILEVLENVEREEKDAMS